MQLPCGRRRPSRPFVHSYPYFTPAMQFTLGLQEHLVTHEVLLTERWQSRLRVRSFWLSRPRANREARPDEE